MWELAGLYLISVLLIQLPLIQDLLQLFAITILIVGIPFLIISEMGKAILRRFGYEFEEVKQDSRINNNMIYNETNEMNNINNNINNLY